MLHMIAGVTAPPRWQWSSASGILRESCRTIAVRIADRADRTSSARGCGPQTDRRPWKACVVADTHPVGARRRGRLARRGDQEQPCHVAGRRQHRLLLGSAELEEDARGHPGWRRIERVGHADDPCNPVDPVPGAADLVTGRKARAVVGSGTQEADRDRARSAFEWLGGPNDYPR